MNNIRHFLLGDCRVEIQALSDFSRLSQWEDGEYNPVLVDETNGFALELLNREDFDPENNTLHGDQDFLRASTVITLEQMETEEEGVNQDVTVLRLTKRDLSGSYPNPYAQAYENGKVLVYWRGKQYLVPLETGEAAPAVVVNNGNLYIGNQSQDLRQLLQTHQNAVNDAIVCADLLPQAHIRLYIRTGGGEVVQITVNGHAAISLRADKEALAGEFFPAATLHSLWISPFAYREPNTAYRLDLDGNNLLLPDLGILWGDEHNEDRLICRNIQVKDGRFDAFGKARSLYAGLIVHNTAAVTGTETSETCLENITKKIGEWTGEGNVPLLDLTTDNQAKIIANQIDMQHVRAYVIGGSTTVFRHLTTPQATLVAGSNEDTLDILSGNILQMQYYGTLRTGDKLHVGNKMLLSYDDAFALDEEGD